MISKKKNLNDVDMDTWTKSCSPTIVKTINGDVHTHEEATVYVKELDIFLTMKVLKNTPAVLSLGKLCDENGYYYEWINGQKTHLTKNGIRIQCDTESFVLSWFQACQRVRPPILVIQLEGHFQDRRGLVLHLPQARLLHQRHHQVIMRLEKEKTELKVILSSACVNFQCVDDKTEQPVVDEANQKFPITSQKETKKKRGNPLSADTSRASSEIPEWLQEFMENLVDDEAPERGDSHVSFSHEVSLQPTFKRREDLDKHSVYTHFPRDRNCEICQRTKITRAPCRRRKGGAALRAENFGGLITADHKVLSDNCDSRNNHRYAVVVQDLVTQWIQAYRVKQKLLRKHKGVCKSSWSPMGSQKSFTRTILWNLAKLVKIYFGIIARLHHIDQKQMGFAERAVRSVNEGTSAVLLQSGLNENWWADSMECNTYLRNVKDLLSDGKTPYERRFEQPFEGPIIPLGSLVEYYPITAKDQSRIH